MAGTMKVVRDHYLFREGDAPDAMYVIKSGKLAVVKSKQSSEIILAEIGPGSMVGEMAFFDNKPRSASVKALKDSEVIALPYKSLHAQFHQFPEWTKAIMRTINDHLRNANQRIKQLEKTEGEAETFPPHTINKLVSILNLVGIRYGKKEPDGLHISGNVLRNFTIQVFQEPTHKMQKLTSIFTDLQILKVEDLGEGKQKIIIYKPNFLFDFVEWHNEWLFKKETERVLIKEEELRPLNALLHFARKAPFNDRGNKELKKISLIEIQNNSMKELGFLLKMDDFNSFIEKKILTEKTMDSGGVFTCVDLKEIEKITPFWELIYTLRRPSR